MWNAVTKQLTWLEWLILCKTKWDSNLSMKSVKDSTDSSNAANVNTFKDEDDDAFVAEVEFDEDEIT